MFEIAWKKFLKTFFSFENTCACVLGLERVCPRKGCPWPWIFLCPWPWALCSRLHLYLIDLVSLRFFAFLRSCSNSDVATGGGRGPCPPYRMLVPSGGSRKFWWGIIKILSTKPQKFGCLHRNWEYRKFKRFFRPKSGGLKKKRSSPKLRLVFRRIKRFFRPKSGGLQKKKKKVFTEIETDFSAEIVSFRLVGGDASPPSPP